MSQGRRYSREEKKEILQFRQTHTYQETSQKFGVSEMTLARWSKRIDTHTYIKDRPLNSNFNSWLQVIGAIREVKAVAVISDLGEIVAILNRDNLDEDMILVETANLLAKNSEAIERLYKNEIKMLFIQSAEVIFFIIEAGEHNILSIFMKPILDIRNFFIDDFPFIEKIRDLIKQAKK
jgi:predicted regulator of Ras-like GTPase activity (Roadblock/LC7/MglB family)